MKKRIRKKLQRYCCPRCRSQDVWSAIPSGNQRWRPYVYACETCRYTFDRSGREEPPQRWTAEQIAEAKADAAKWRMELGWEDIPQPKEPSR